MPLNRIPNEDALRLSLWGTQPFRDVAVAPTYKMYGDFQVTESLPVSETADFSGTFFQDIEPTFGVWTFGGTYSQNLTYEDLQILPRYLVKGGVVPVTDGNSTPGYDTTYSPSGSTDDLDVASVEHEVPGLPEKAEMVLFNDATIAIDVDDADAVWKFTGNLWIRKNNLLPAVSDTSTGGSTTTIVKTAAGWTTNAHQGAYVEILSGVNAGEVIRVASNDATTLTLASPLPAAIVTGVSFRISGGFTPGLADRTRERISAPGTRMFIDDYPSGTLGTTEELKWISASVTYSNNLAAKRFGPDVDYMSAKLGRGRVVVTGQIRKEFDNRTEVDKWKAKAKRRLRIEQLGSQINAAPLTNKRARIDVFNLVWSDVTRDTRNTNLTRTFAFRGYADPAQGGIPFRLATKTQVAALP
jgi:hypothetical protein